jgi:hypothetical protein
MVPATTRMKTVETPCIGVEPIVQSEEVPTYETVQVCDRATALAPVTEDVCVPVMGYREVEDTTSVLRPVYGTRCMPAKEEVLVVYLRVGSTRGCFRVMAGASRECRDVTKPCRYRIGAEVVQIPAGTHLEQVPVGREAREIAVGAERIHCVTGTHEERRQVGTQRVDRVVGQRRVVAGKNRRQVPVVVRPAHLEGVERRVEVPGRWVRICADAGQSNGLDVMTRGEYEAIVGDRPAGP